MGIIFGLLSMLGWGTADFLTVNPVRKIGPISILLWTQIAGFFITLVYFLANPACFDAGQVVKYLYLLVPAVFLHLVGYLAYYKGFEKGQLSLVSPISASYSMIVVFLSLVFFRESLKVNQVVAVGLLILGIVLVSLDLRKLNAFAGAKEGLISMLGFGFSMFLIIPAARALGWFAPVFLFRFFLLIYLAIFMFFRKRSLKITFPPLSPLFYFSLLAIGFLNTGAFFAYNFGVTKEYASIVSPIGASYPLVAIILAGIFLKEKLVLTQILGIFGVISGLILISF